MPSGNIAIVQARMGSTRLPGKMFLPIWGEALIWHVIHRLRQCELVDRIVVATTFSTADDRIEEFCRDAGVPVVRGPEENVLARFAIAVNKFDPAVIIRVNGDAPLIDPSLVDQLIKAMLDGDAESACGRHGMPCIHDGVDLIGRKSFDRLVEDHADDPVAQEHVTGYLKKDPSFAKTIEIDIEEALQFAGARLSIDTQADIEFIEALYGRLGAPVGTLDLRDVVTLLRANPELCQINSHVRQKQLDQRGGRVLFRCDGGHDIGFGHVMRSLAIARALRDKQGYGVVFAMAADSPANVRVTAERFAVEIWPENTKEEDWIEGLCRRYEPDAVIYDIRTGLSRHSLQKVKLPGQLTVLVDDGSPRRMAGDIVVYPPVQQVDDLDWVDFKGTKLVGWDWTILPERASPPQDDRSFSEAKRLLVSMGGSDPLNLTWDVACHLKSADTEVTPVFVIGPGFGEPDLLEKRLRNLWPDAEIVREVPTLSDLFSEVNAALTMYGVTAQELAAAGVPAFYVCLDHDHSYSARSLAGRGIGIDLGLADDIDWNAACQKIAAVLRDEAELRLMSKRGPRIIDGHGATRLASLIAQKLKHRAAA